MKPYIKTILLLLIPLVLIAAYALWGGDWWFEKADFTELEKRLAQSADTTETPKAAIDSTVSANDRLQEQPEQPQPLDTTKQRILFFGDSMLEGLSRRLCDFTMENGHELTSVIWYSSTSQTWAESDTLEHFLKKTDPTFVIVCLCSNELFVRDLSARDEYIKEIVGKIGDTPFVWISPPNWTEDTGINELIIKNVGTSRYFDSRNLQLERGRDKVHPTFGAAETWMDSVAVWMSGNDTHHPIRMSVPQEKRKRKYSLHLLMPPE